VRKTNPRKNCNFFFFFFQSTTSNLLYEINYFTASREKLRSCKTPQTHAHTQRNKALDSPGRPRETKRKGRLQLHQAGQHAGLLRCMSTLLHDYFVAGLLHAGLLRCWSTSCRSTCNCETTKHHHTQTPHTPPPPHSNHQQIVLLTTQTRSENIKTGPIATKGSVRIPAHGKPIKSAKIHHFATTKFDKRHRKACRSKRR